MSEQPSREPSFRQLAAYALPALPIAALAFPFYVMVPEFYARDLGVPIATVGLVLLFVRVLDAVTDPLAGRAGRLDEASLRPATELGAGGSAARRHRRLVRAARRPKPPAGAIC